MPFPYRSIKSIQPLPSIYTAFPVNHGTAQTSIDSAINSGTCLIRHIEDGIEVVPFERCHDDSAPILSPSQDEKEVLFVSQLETENVEKLLPSLPGSVWQRMSIRQRILALLFTQFIMLMAIGLALMATKRRPSTSYLDPQARTADNDVAHTKAVYPIQCGIFAVSLQLPQQQSSACIANMNESVAWQCATDTRLQLSILPSPVDENDTMLITLGPFLNNGTLQPGHQVPNLQPTRLTALVSTTSDNQTYYFRSTYDKIVYLNASDLSSVSTQFIPTQPTLQSGETLWRCTFKETPIEGFIYVGQPSLSKTNDTSPASDGSMVAGITTLPYVVKLIEQRSSGTPKPYCENFIVQEDGNTATVTENLWLNVRESVSRARHRPRLIEHVRLKRKSQTQSANSCRCQWLLR